MTAHSVLNVRAAPEWGNSELYRYYERNGLGYRTVQKRYALQIWLEVEVEPGYFLPPEDDSYSTDFTLEVLNHAYPGCTGVYLDRGGHMLAFYGWKGSPKAGLIQDVAIEAGHTVREIPWVS